MNINKLRLQDFLKEPVLIRRKVKLKKPNFKAIKFNSSKIRNKLVYPLPGKKKIDKKIKQYLHVYQKDLMERS